jgi:hypothetical protein
VIATLSEARTNLQYCTLKDILYANMKAHINTDLGGKHRILVKIKDMKM